MASVVNGSSIGEPSTDHLDLTSRVCHNCSVSKPDVIALKCSHTLCPDCFDPEKDQKSCLECEKRKFASFEDDLMDTLLKKVTSGDQSSNFHCITRDVFSTSDSQDLYSTKSLSFFSNNVSNRELELSSMYQPLVKPFNPNETCQFGPTSEHQLYNSLDNPLSHPINGSRLISSNGHLFHSTAGTDFTSQSNLQPTEHNPSIAVSESSLVCSCDMTSKILAQYRCLECAENLCSECESAHRRVTITKNHKIINVTNVMTKLSNPEFSNFSFPPPTMVAPALIPEKDASLDVLEGVPCKLHENQWALRYCRQCQVSLCTLCLHDHLNHEISNIKESSEGIVAEIRELEREARSGLQSIDGSLLKIDQVDEDCRESLKFISREVSTHFDEVNLLLHNTCNNLIKIASEIGNEKSSILQKQCNALQEAKKDLNETLGRICKANLDQLEYSDLVGISGDLRHTLNKIQPIQHYLQPHVTEYIEIQKVGRHTLDKILNGITFTTNGFAENSDAYGHGIKTVVCNADAHFKIVSKDMQGQQMSKGGEEVEASIEIGNRQSHKLPIADLGDGTYLVKYRVDHIGQVKIHARLRGLPIKGSPFTVTVRPKTIYCKLDKPFRSLRNGTHTFTVNRPWGVCTDELGRIYIADRLNHKICTLDSEGVLVDSFGEMGSAPGQLDRPSAMLIDRKGRLVIVDKDNHRIQVFTKNGEFISCHGNRGRGRGEFVYPWDIAQDQMSGRFAVSDSRNSRVQVFSESFEFLETIRLVRPPGVQGSQRMEKLLDTPRGVCFGPNGVLYVTDFVQHCFFVFYKDSKKYVQISGPGMFDGQLCRPQGLTVDRDGNILICDSKNGRIQVFSPNGAYLGKFGTSQMTGICGLRKPCDIALAPDGTVIVMDLETEMLHFF